MQKSISYLITAFSILFIGCSSSSDLPNPDADLEQEIRYGNQSYDEVRKIKPYQLQIKPLIGSRSNDSKVVVDYGKVLKVYIASYKQGSTLIAAHDLYTFVKKPEFIVGESVPQRRTDNIPTPLSKLPFYITDGELDIDTAHREMSDEEVRQFVNKLYQKRYGNNLNSSVKEYLQKKYQKQIIVRKLKKDGVRDADSRVVIESTNQDGNKQKQTLSQDAEEDSIERKKEIDILKYLQKRRRR